MPVSVCWVVGDVGLYHKDFGVTEHSVLLKVQGQGPWNSEKNAVRTCVTSGVHIQRKSRRAESPSISLACFALLLSLNVLWLGQSGKHQVYYFTLVRNSCALFLSGYSKTFSYSNTGVVICMKDLLKKSFYASLSPKDELAVWRACVWVFVLWMGLLSHSHPATELDRESAVPRWQGHCQGVRALPSVQTSLRCPGQPVPRVNVSAGRRVQWFALDKYVCPLCLHKIIWSLEEYSAFLLSVSCICPIGDMWHYQLQGEKGPWKEKGQVDKILHFLKLFLLSFS